MEHITDNSMWKKIHTPPFKYIYMYKSMLYTNGTAKKSIKLAFTY